MKTWQNFLLAKTLPSWLVLTFLSMAFGGPAAYSGRGMQAAHAKLVEKANESHFASIAGHLQATLEELSVPAELIGEVMAIASSTKDACLAYARLKA